MRIVSLGHAAFAAVMIALGIEGLITGAFPPVWQPVPKGVPAREALAYLCAVVSLACGFGLLWRRAAAAASRILFTFLLLWLLVFRVGGILRAPAAFDAWDGCAETAVMVAGAWVLRAWFAVGTDRWRLGLATGNSVQIARMLYGLAMIPFGLAHFLYAKQTATLVPRWLPAHMALAYVTGALFLAAGTAVLVDVCAPLAARLSALQIGVFTLLVWVPIVAARHPNAFQWSEFVISTALTAGAWLVADSYGTIARVERAGSGQGEPV
jgi:uncharacterized membrane protein